MTISISVRSTNYTNYITSFPLLSIVTHTHIVANTTNTLRDLTLAVTKLSCTRLSVVAQVVMTTLTYYQLTSALHQST